MNVERVIERARFLASLRVPFVHQGTTLQGIDCVGALAYILEYEGEIPAYPRDPVNGELESELERELGTPLIEVNRARPLTDASQLRACDVLSMQYAGPTRHVAIVIPHINLKGVFSIVHTDSNVGHVTEHILDEKWLRRIVKVWRL